jgi:uncharacterized repeat protein (TIGR01451 family)
MTDLVPEECIRAGRVRAAPPPDGVNGEQFPVICVPEMEQEPSFERARLRGFRCHVLGACVIVGLFALGAFPTAGAASTTGALWATQSDATAGQNVVAFGLEGSDDLLSAPVFAGTADTPSHGVAVTPNDQYVYVTNSGGNSVSQYSVSSATGDLTPLSPATAVVSASGGADPETIAVDPTGSWAFTANAGANTVSVLRINPQTGQLTLVDELDPSTELDDPTGVAISADGDYVYVANHGGADIAQFDIDTTTGDLTPMSAPTATVPGAAPTPARIITTSDGYAYVTDPGDGAIVQYTINGSGGLTAATVTASSDGGPLGLVSDTTASPETLYVAAGPEVDEYTIQAGGAIVPNADEDHIGDSENSSGIAVAPDGDEVYVGNVGGDDISLYGVAADGTLTADGTAAAGDDPSQPLAANLPSASSPPTPVGGALVQLPEPNDCITSDPFGCNYSGAAVPVNSMLDSYQPVVSPDSNYAYVVAQSGDLDEYRRDPSTGALSYIGCVSGGSDCGAGNTALAGMVGPRDMAISSDGQSAYVVADDNGDGALVAFTVENNGSLSYLGCWSQDDSSCAPSGGLANPYGVVVSADGNNVYATSFDDSSVLRFGRPSPTTLNYVSCITTDSANPGDCTTPAPADYGDLLHAAGIQVSPNGDNVYVASGGTSGSGGDVVEFSRASGGTLTQLTGANSCITTGNTDYPNCGTTDGIGFDGGTEDLAITLDGQNVYLNSYGDNGVIELSRNTSSGVLTELAEPNACIAEETSPSGMPSCTQPPYPQEHGTGGALGVAVSPDGLDVYVSGSADNGVSSFSRNPTTGALSPLPFDFGCITGGPQDTEGTCPEFNTNGLYDPRRLVVSPDGTSVYVADQTGFNGIGGDGIVELARTTPANLALSESGAPSNTTIGGQITYVYTVTNGGPAAATGPTFTVPLATELSLVSATASQGSCSGSTTVTCSLGALADGASATVSITARLASSGSAGVTADVADVLDTNTYNNSTTTTTTVAPAPSASITPPPALVLASPVLSVSADVAPVSGTILVRLPGSSVFVSLSSAENIPMGSTIDATHGTVAITVALPDGTAETGDFYDGEFVVTQAADGRVFETLTGGSFVGCPVPGKAHKHKKKSQLVAAVAKKKPATVVRQLWGNAHGDFTTKGRYGSAAVSGTIWLTQDRCDGTYFKVTKDTIVVVAFAHPSKQHNLKQGQSILVPKP